jgi:hypothetical protein
MSRIQTPPAFPKYKNHLDTLKYHRLKNTAQAGGHLGHIKALK